MYISDFKGCDACCGTQAVWPRTTSHHNKGVLLVRMAWFDGLRWLWLRRRAIIEPLNARCWRETSGVVGGDEGM